MAHWAIARSSQWTMLRFWIVTLFIWCFWTSVCEGQSAPVVVTKQGPVRGIRTLSDTRTPIMAFLGIPYAAPPTEQNRFMPPDRHRGWPNDQAFDASEFGPACIQPLHELEPSFGITPEQSEDCLTLNVWTAEVTTSYRDAPVLVFLEGEGFVSGYPGRFPGEDIAAEGVVVVSVSYRLNVFGFLCLENSEARGNMGLLDQYLALVWIRENIEAFGGDSRSVTMMGHSAGAGSIGYHMISPRTKGLFHRAILMSGSILSPWMASTSNSNSSLEIAKSVGCLRSKTKAILNCLRSKSSEELLRAFETQYMNGNWSQLTLPVVDNFLPEEEQYLPLSPKEALIDGLFLKIPVLTGVTANDGSVVINQWSDMMLQGFLKLEQFFTSQVIPAVAQKYNFTSTIHYNEIKTILQWYYLDPANNGDATLLLSKMVDFYTDAQFKAPHYKQLTLLANKIPDPSTMVYAYQFEQDDNYLYKKLNITGGGHGEELLMIFGPALLKRIGKIRFTPAEDRLSSIMKRFWMEFVRKGTLSSSPYSYGITWTKYVPSIDNYIIFRVDNNLPASQPVMRSPSLSFTKDAIGRQVLWLWNDLLPNLKDLEDTREQQEPLSRPIDAPMSRDLPYKSAMYTLIAFVIVLLILLIVCVILLKRHATERERDMF